MWRKEGAGKASRERERSRKINIGDIEGHVGEGELDGVAPVHSHLDLKP